MDAWLTLLRTPSIGPATLRTAVARHGSASTALEALRRGDSPRELDAEARRWLDAPDPARMEADLEWLEHPDHHLLGWDDPDYPSLLREIPGAPAALFVDGDPTLLWMPQVAIVGSRSASEHGLALCRRFARALASAGFTVTSGMADGIDGAAHQAALDADARTVAVLGTGPDLVYPRKHRALAARIAASGALVSEFPPGTAAKPEHFPRRNRIISGLALGTLVVEAGLRSGSLITARCASEQGREVFAIPGSINNPLARGCHQLIRQGAALVETVQEVVDALAPVAAELANALRARLGRNDSDHSVDTASPPSEATGTADPDYQRLWDALGHDPVGIDLLAERTGLTVDTLSSMLLLMELDGRVSSHLGRYARAAT